MKKTEQKIISFIDHYELIKFEDRVLIALSGGPDSVFLLHFLHKFCKRFRIDLSAFHLNHKIRGSAADKDEKFCAELCEELGLNFYSATVDVTAEAGRRKISVEVAGRNSRYAELNKIAELNNINKIATAHNADDNAETVLLNLIKGTGLRGISGIPVKRENLIRPVLILSKKEVLEYLHDKNITYRKDKSNLKNDYERNYLRNRIIPLIKSKLNPSLENTIFNSSQNFRNHLNLFEQELLNEIEALAEISNGVVKINLIKILSKDEAKRPEIIKLLIERNFVRMDSYNHAIFKDVSKVLSLLKKQSGTNVNLSGNLSAARERDEILIFPNAAEKEIPAQKLKAGDKVEVNGKTLFINSDAKFTGRFSNNNLVEYISADNLDEQFILRAWKAGDRFYPLGLKGSKKVSDFLNEQKVISVEKKRQLVLTNGGKIVWVLGLRIDERFKINHSTKKVYQLCLI